AEVNGLACQHPRVEIVHHHRHAGKTLDQMFADRRQLIRTKVTGDALADRVELLAAARASVQLLAGVKANLTLAVSGSHHHHIWTYFAHEPLQTFGFHMQSNIRPRAGSIDLTPQKYSIHAGFCWLAARRMPLCVGEASLFSVLKTASKTPAHDAA